MPIHRPKHISSIIGLGLPNTTRVMKNISVNVGIGTEIWNEMSEPWSEGSTIIAQPGYKWVTKWETGLPYIISKFYDDNGVLVAVYCDVARPVEKTSDGFEFSDLYLDIWWIPGQEPTVLDADELQEALNNNYISEDEAKEAGRVAAVLLDMIKNNNPALDF